MDVHIGQRVRYTSAGSVGYLVGDDVVATLSAGALGTVVEQLPDQPYRCPPEECIGGDCACEGTGTVPADPAWVVAWECPEGTTCRRLIRADGDGWQPAQQT